MVTIRKGKHIADIDIRRNTNEYLENFKNSGNRKQNLGGNKNKDN